MKYIFLACLLAVAQIGNTQTATETSGETPSKAPSTSPLTLTLGGKLFSGGWTGENTGAIEGDIESTTGGGIGVSVGLRKGKWFGVFNVQSGGYEFDGDQPAYDPDPIAEDELTINSSFVSLGAGYQINRYVAVQGGFKTHTQNWDDHNRELVYSGLGVGVTGFIPLNQSWTLYGTLGLNGHTIKDKDGENVGDGSTSSLELGAAFRITSVSSISFGFKNESVAAEFDSGNEQEHNFGSLYFGYNHGFRF
ncbi:MAG: porin family protein [Agarilytica sp.]